MPPWTFQHCSEITMSGFRKLWWCAALALVVLSAHAESLSVQDAQHRAVDRSRQLAAQDSAVRSSREKAPAARPLPPPLPKMGVDNLPINGEDRFSVTRDFMTMRRIGVMQELTRGEKRDLRAQRFEREAEKGVAEKAMATASIERGTALAWLERYYAEAMLKVVAEQIEQVQGEITAAEAVYRGGRGSQADVIRAHNTLAALEDKARQLMRRAPVGKTHLARWMGEGADAPLAALPTMETVRLDEATLDQDLLHHPEIAVLAKQEQIAVAEAKIDRPGGTQYWSARIG